MLIIEGKVWWIPDLWRLFNAHFVNNSDVQDVIISHADGIQKIFSSENKSQ